MLFIFIYPITKWWHPTTLRRSGAISSGKSVSWWIFQQATFEDTGGYIPFNIPFVYMIINDYQWFTITNHYFPLNAIKSPLNPIESPLNHPKSPPKSPWNHPKSPWNHHEITMKSPWNHHEITIACFFFGQTQALSSASHPSPSHLLAWVISRCCRRRYKLVYKAHEDPLTIVISINHRYIYIYYSYMISTTIVISIP